MGINDLLQEKREDILRIAAKHRVTNLRVFGSVARGQAGPDSDVDFLVQLPQDCSLLDHAGFIVELQDLLGKTVDVIPESGLRPAIREKVLREAVTL